MNARRLTIVRSVLWLPCLFAVLSLVGCGGAGQAPPRDAAHTIFVSNSPDCGGQRPCYAGLQEAVDAASEGGVIKVAVGTYTAVASGAEVSFPPPVVEIKKAVLLTGGYSEDDWSGPAAPGALSVVDAELVPGRRVLLIDGRGVPSITVRGLRIRRGVDESGSGGGGVYVVGGSVVLEGNTIEESAADTRGGGLLVAGGDVRLSDNTFTSNAARFGGGLYVNDGTILMERNVFRGNAAPPVGGAIAIAGGEVTGANNMVVDNASCGAGVYLTSGELIANHWTVVNNGEYGVIADLGIDIDRGSVTVRKSILASHRSGLCGAGASARQTLFYDVEHPCMAGASCVNNLFGDPKFVNAEAGDYHITADSAAVDQGYSVDTADDIDGDARPVGTAADIGADEISPERTYLPLVVRNRGSAAR